MAKYLDYLSDESGASAAEYALILALVDIVIVAGATVLGTNINLVLGNAATSL